MTTSAAKANRRADIVDRLEAEVERLRAALTEAADWIKDLDGGDQRTETGWKSDESLAVWIKARKALGYEQTPGSTAK